jgi:hypothetical protein
VVVEEDSVLALVAEFLAVAFHFQVVVVHLKIYEDRLVPAAADLGLVQVV